MSQEDKDKAKEVHKKLFQAKEDLPNRLERLQKQIENNEVKGTVVIKGDEPFKGFEE